MKAKKLYVDCQIFQTDAYDRGMGKYSYSLLKEFLNKTKEEFVPIFIFNENLLMEKSRIELITGLSKKSVKLIVNLPTELVFDTNRKYAKAEQEITKLIASDLSGEKGAAYLILAPFFVDFAAVYPLINNLLKVSVVYDIIPHLIWHKQRIFPDELYYRHFKTFESADYLLTISEAVKNDLMNYIGIASEKIVTIDGGAFKAKDTASNNKLEKYIIYPSAPIIHKNNTKAVQGFSQFNESHGNKYKLLFTSYFDKNTKAMLKKICPDIVFTGVVSDTEMKNLYRGCNAVLFASLAEGLGMPVLEGVQQEKPVACSNIPVLSEISKDAFYFFDPNSSKEIALALESAVSKKDWIDKRALYKRIKLKYTWERSAAIMLEVFRKPSHNLLNKKNLLIICPDSRWDNPESKLIEKIYMGLSEVYNIQVKFKGVKGSSVPSFIPYICNENQIEKIDRSLTITRSSRKIKSKSDESFQIVVKRNSRSIILSNILSKKRTIPLLMSVRTIEYKPLELYGWIYGKNNIGKFEKMSTKKLVFFVKELIK